MRNSEVVATFEATKAKACGTSTPVLKLRIRRVRRKVNRHGRELDHVQLVALQAVLNTRLGPTPLGQRRPA